MTHSHGARVTTRLTISAPTGPIPAGTAATVTGVSVFSRGVVLYDLTLADGAVIRRVPCIAIEKAQR